MQFVHEDDVGQALLLCIVGAGPPGAYNIAGDGVLAATEVARELELAPDASVDSAAPARDQLVAVFDAVETLATSQACLGCAFQESADEFPDRAHPGHATALAHKEAVRTRLRGLAAAAGATHTAALGGALLLVMDVAFAAARMYGPTSPAAHAAGAARTLIGAHLPARRPRPRQRPAGGT